MKNNLLIKISCMTFGFLMLCAMFTSCGVGRSNDYYNEKLLSVIEEEKEVKLSEIFDFEFDSAYFSIPAHESYADKDHFLELLDAKSKLKIDKLNSEGFARILFIKDGNIIYDFWYSTIDLRFLETGVLSASNSTVKYIEKNEHDIPVFQISETEKLNEP